MLLPLLLTSALASSVWHPSQQVFKDLIEFDDVGLSSVQNEEKGGFQFYVFAHSWQPSFCFGTSYPGCVSPQDYWRTHFTVHGLWPEMNKGPHPGFCSKEDLDIERVRAALGEATLEKYWPNVKVMENSTHYDEFWHHEWSRHGTCSGLDQVTFFKTAIQKIELDGTPAFVTAHVGQMVSAADVRKSFGGAQYAVLKCDGKRLSQVFTCYNKTDVNVPLSLRPCAPHVLQEDTCSGHSVLIPSF
jgi:ribonuclease T2